MKRQADNRNHSRRIGEPFGEVAEAASELQVAVMYAVFGQCPVMKHSAVLMERGLGYMQQDVDIRRSRFLEVVLDFLGEQYAARFDLMALEAKSHDSHVRGLTHIDYAITQDFHLLAAAVSTPIESVER